MSRRRSSASRLAIGVAALRGLTMNARSRVLKAAVLVLRVPLRLLVSAAGVAAIVSTSTPQGNEHDAQQGSYQSPQNLKRPPMPNSRSLVAGENQKRGQYQGQQAKGSIACHWLHFSQRQRGRAQSQLGYISLRRPAASARDLLPGYFRDIPRAETLSARS